MTNAEQSNPLENLEQELATRRTKGLLRALNELPAFDGKHEHIPPETALLRYVVRDLKDQGRALNESLDPGQEYAQRETVLAYASQLPDGSLPFDETHRTLEVQPGTCLWPLNLLPEEQSRFTELFIDPLGRIFGVGTERLPEKMNPDHRFFPIEVRLSALNLYEALSAHQATLDLTDTISHIKNQPRN